MARSEGSLISSARVFFAAVLLVAAMVMPANPARSQNLVVFAAASLKNALDDANGAFAHETGVKIVTSYAASSALAKQIEAGAPADIFISADLDWMDYLGRKDLVKSETRTNLLANSIVLIAPAGGGATDVVIKPDFPLSQLLGDGRLALAEPNSVPAGKYAKAALESLGVWPSVSGRLAPAENVRAALLLVARGEAPLGIVYRTDAAAERDVKIVGAFPASSHPPIVYPLAVVARSANPASASYVAFLQSSSARPFFEKQGFAVLE
jgi:molybdate transport system substrate-binding protein